MNISSGVIPSAQKVVLYGPEGIGKSTFLAQFPDPLFIDTEGSTKRLDVRRFNAPTSWTMLLEQVRYVITHLDCCGTLCIDTADWAEQMLTDHICAKSKVNGIEDFGYGKGYTYVAEEFGKLLHLLDDVIARGIHIAIAAHAAMRKFEQPDELGAYDRWEMKLSKKCAAMLKEWADMVLFANYKTYTVKQDNAMLKTKAQGGKRVMYTAHHPCWDAKNRCGLPEIADFDFAVIAAEIAEQTVPQPSPVEERRAAFISAVETINNAVEDAPPETPSSAVPNDAVRALLDLIRDAGVTLDDVQRIVASEGYYPADTQISDYDPDFIRGWLIAYWNDIVNMIKK